MEVLIFVPKLFNLRLELFLLVEEIENVLVDHVGVFDVQKVVGIGDVVLFEVIVECCCHVLSQFDIDVVVFLVVQVYVWDVRVCKYEVV